MKEAASAPESLVRPRYGRIAAFGASTLVCAVAFLGGLGVLPDGGTPASARTSSGSLELSGSGATDTPADTPADAGPETGASLTQVLPDQGVAGEPQPAPAGSRPLPRVADDASVAEADPTDFPLPENSGEGRRVVFDLDQQRVWLVTGKGTVRRTYAASGSVSDNLKAGTYEVYSRSEDAVGIDGTTMRWMVRFTQGKNAAIGFHDLPVGQDGRPVQRLRDLGTALSHGCIRQAPGDAQALWRFAPLGTPVVVTG
jgi:hypothetical protein